MKAKIIFNLDDPEDAVRFRQIANLSGIDGFLFHILHNYVREVDRAIETGEDTYDAFIRLLNNSMEEYGITDDIIQS